VTPMSLKGKTRFITGASRGIGLAIALRAAADGANIAIAAKTETPHPNLEGTIHSAAAEVEKAGGQALPLVVDVRDEAAVKGAIDRTAARFGSLDTKYSFGPTSTANTLTPVRLPPGRFRLATSPICTGSLIVVKTIGIVAVAAFAACAAGVVNAAIAATPCWVRSAARAGSRSYWLSAQRPRFLCYAPRYSPYRLSVERRPVGPFARNGE
jgi:NAD(P)-dependent dehydrogenase (short-subunit alcohol dehydrogenase family)